MNVVDSSAWLEYFADGPNADYFAPAIEDTRRLVVPTICLLEVFKVVARQRPMRDAIDRIAHMRQATVVDLTHDLAIAAAMLGIEHKLPLADSVILATARAHRASVWTQDADFQNIPDVRYRAKK